MSEQRCGHCTHYSHGECWAAAMKMVHEADSERVDAVVDLDKAEDEIARLRAALRALVDVDCYSGNEVCRLQDDARGLLETPDRSKADGT